MLEIGKKNKQSYRRIIDHHKFLKKFLHFYQNNHEIFELLQRTRALVTTITDEIDNDGLLVSGGQAIDKA